MTDSKKRVFILLGMPGVGKGTQAQKIAAHYNLLHIDTGQTLRGEIALGTELGNTAKAYVDKGELVPFDLVIEVIKAGMLRITPDKQGYLFDGFPRNAEQAVGMDSIMSSLSLNLNAVLYLETPHDLLMDRLAYRVTCPLCDRKYNLKLKPPVEENKCDFDQTELVTRKDDRPEVIENRLKAYETETSPLISLYTERKLLTRINADDTVEAVFSEIQQAIGAFLTEAEPASVSH